METIGDAYMVVGGLPEYIETHADRVVSMAVGMIEVSRNVMMPADQKPIQVRKQSFL
jgi:class 3 adenylate cyclase